MPYKGVGINVGDGQSDYVTKAVSAYTHAFNNTVVNFANGGISIPHGYSNRVYRNTVVHSGYILNSNGIPEAHGGLSGIAIGDYSDYKWDLTNQVYRDNIAYENTVGVSSEANGMRCNDVLNTDCARDANGVPLCYGNNNGFKVNGIKRQMTCQDEKDAFDSWQASTRTSSINVGPQTTQTYSTGSITRSVYSARSIEISTPVSISDSPAEVAADRSVRLLPGARVNPRVRIYTNIIDLHCSSPEMYLPRPGFSTNCGNVGTERIRISSEHSKGAVGAENTMNVYPNPTNGIFNIDYRLAEAGVVTLAVVDAYGRQVIPILNKQHQLAGAFSMHVSGRNLKQGVYLCTLRTGTQRLVKRVVMIQ